MNRIVFPLSAIALLAVSCRAPARRATAVVEPAASPTQIAVTTEPPTVSSTATNPPTDTPSSTPSPAPPATATPAPTATTVQIQVTPGTTEVVYSTGEFELSGYLCTPAGTEPLPAVVYNHGGMGDQIGGAPLETCEALAAAGFVGFSPIRRPTVPLGGHLDDVFAAMDYVKQLEYVDDGRVAITGFSRGGMLTFMAATTRPEEFDAIVIMAAAEEIVERFGASVDKISAPVLLLIAENDNARQDHVQTMQQLRDVMVAAGKDVTFIMYPPYGNDGHQMFFEVGDYWPDVAAFLQAHLE